MHITLAHSLAILSILTYSCTALVLQQTTVGLQNDSEYDGAAEQTISPPTAVDSNPFFPRSLSTIPSDKSSPTIILDEPMDAGTASGAKLPARNLGPLGQEGFNIATYLTNPTNTQAAVTSQILAPAPSITADPSWSEIFLTPTTTVIIPASTIYYTVATVTVTARSINTFATDSVISQVYSALPQTFQTITTRSSTLTSSILRHGNGKRGFEEDKKACEALEQSEVLNCLVTKGLLVPYTTVTEVLGGKTMVLVEVSVGAGRGRREAVVTGRV
ncbi:uncharacterized protein EAF02_002049 [Botrytis sinoallii]|uniref:uncharacterized protein n=1 Tax=Botrytis sinoallii TaxID=1463999 RepID=UPI0019005DE0|nr:uncharacterized protein EAF02_002049 [Botrytis sinoallii]KAF7889634.1 hypothetical protein EAF02_002049 [Botrytis sinoallii]